MSAVVIWRPEPLTARLIAAARPAASDYSRLAAARAPSKRVAASMQVFGGGTNFTVGPTHPLGGMFESGVGPHEIEGGYGKLRMADGRWVTGPVRHPGMRAQPFLRPLIPLWPALYRRHATGSFRGF